MEVMLDEIFSGPKVANFSTLDIKCDDNENAMTMFQMF